jgi:glycosyltransferase involved in cell wall biosynthesis
MKYPYILLFRHDKYSYIDDFINKNKDNLICTIFIINNKEELNKMFDSNYHLLVTFGKDESEYQDEVHSIITDNMRKRWLHLNELNENSIHNFNNIVNNAYLACCVTTKEYNRPIFSLFTTCYNSYNKIIRAYDSIKTQILKDWEWVILDDSPNDEHFQFLKMNFLQDKRIRLYKRSENNGNIGNVKNEAVSLCRGKYVLEMDHDDEILPYVLSDAAGVFDKDDSVGFVYMDFINICEDDSDYRYGDFFGLGYSGYYRQKIRNKWRYVAMTPNINNITLYHIVSVPNHPRIWRRKTLIEIENYCEYLPILDDYEVLIRTAVHTKMARIHKVGYIQYMNNGNNNFSLIRNSEINRIIWNLSKRCYELYDIDNFMKNKDAYENPTYKDNSSQIWKRKNFEHKYCNELINLNFKKQYCILGLDSFYNKLDVLKTLYENENNDFLLLDNKIHSDKICDILDRHNFSRMKCYSMNDCTEDELLQYFLLLYKSCDDYIILYEKNENQIAAETPNTTKVACNISSNWCVHYTKN